MENLTKILKMAKFIILPHHPMQFNNMMMMYVLLVDISAQLQNTHDHADDQA